MNEIRKEKMEWKKFLEYCNNPTNIPTVDHFADQFRNLNPEETGNTNRKKMKCTSDESRSLPGKCVRYIGLVQDICDKEYYNGVVEEVSIQDPNDRKLIYGKYSDNIQSTDSNHYLDFDSSACKIFERQPIVTVAVPGISPWAHPSSDANIHGNSSPNSMTSVPCEYKEGDATLVGQKRSRANEGDTSSVCASSKQPKYILKLYPEVNDLFKDTTSLGHVDQGDIAYENDMCPWYQCIDQKLYEDIKLNDMIEVIALVHPSTTTAKPEVLTSSHVSVNEAPPAILHCLLARRLPCSYPLLLNPMLSPSKVNLANPSVHPREAVLEYLFKAICNNEVISSPSASEYMRDICEYLMLSMLSSGEKNKASFDELGEEVLVGYLPLNLFFGDAFPFRMEDKDPSGMSASCVSGSQEGVRAIIDNIYNTLASLLPLVLKPNDVADAMNNEQFFITQRNSGGADAWMSGGLSIMIDPATLSSPNEDAMYDTPGYSIDVAQPTAIDIPSHESVLLERVVPSVLQCARGTLVILDETAIQSGNISANAKENMLSLKEYCTKQNILLKCDVDTIPDSVKGESAGAVPINTSVLKIPVDNPVLSFSQTRSMFLHHEEYASYWLPCNYCCAGHSNDTRPMEEGDDASMDSVPDTSSLFEEDGLEDMRTYIASCRNLSSHISEGNINRGDARGAGITMPNEVIHAVEEYFVKYQNHYDNCTSERKPVPVSPSRSTKMLHRLLTLARLITISHGDTAISIAHWTHAVSLEERRMKQSTTRYELLNK